MKIQCDVCEKEEAMVFCPADEAALCQACDHRVHHANKLATKHHRLSLQCPSSKDCPRCDICQKRRALLFCREDRAILCRECDGTIHQANEFSKKHNRFLLTGAKLSTKTCTTYQASSPSSGSSSFHDLTSESSNPMKSTNNYDFWGPSSYVMTPESTLNLSEVNSHCHGTNQMAPVSSGSITEYLMETLPGWRVDDFLDASSPYGFCKILSI
ncbi:hypothetical protein LIER_06983 [Lithospermum erythrorhizon]|uniref:B box-type domain-containing protein n=1 Tax=Lithospermum erythrorhizon TaxID=34254 RepID=A0AAV3P7I8_LITER